MNKSKKADSTGLKDTHLAFFIEAEIVAERPLSLFDPATL
jgi:hypothetical protein